MNIPAWLTTAINNTQAVLNCSSNDPLLQASATRELEYLHQLQAQYSQAA
jgi:hypothetical protein